MRKIAMRCTQENFDSIKDRIKYKDIGSFRQFPFLTNCYKNGCVISNTNIPPVCEIYETFDAEIFLRACDSLEEEVKYEVYLCGQWYETRHLIRVKTQPNYSKGIEALQFKAKENGMKCTINFEKI